MRLISIAMLIGISCSDLAIAQDAALKKSVDRELSILGSFVELDDKTKRKIRQDLQNVLAEESDEHDGLTFLFGHIPPSVFDVLLKSIDERISNNAETKPYKVDLNVRRMFHRNASATALMLMLDRAVGVPESQWQELSREVSKLASKDVLPPMYSLESWKPDETVIEAFARVLTREQLASLKTNLSLTRQDHFSTSMYKGSNEQRSADLKAELKRLAAAQTRWLKHELKLRPPQVRRMELAAKGAVQGVLSDRIAAENKLRSQLKEAGGMDASDSETKFAMVDQARLLTRHSRWRRLVLSSLDDQQKAAFLKIERKRAVVEHGSDVDQFVIVLSREIALNADELTKLRKLVDHKVPPLKPGQWATWYDPWVAFANITETELLAAVGQDNAAVIQADLARVQAQLAARASGNEDKPAPNQ